MAGPGESGGRGGIRTHGEFYPTFDFESSALNRAQPPFRYELQLSKEAAVLQSPKSPLLSAPTGGVAFPSPTLIRAFDVRRKSLEFSRTLPLRTRINR
jgi:hypothetical protein